MLKIYSGSIIYILQFYPNTWLYKLRHIVNMGLEDSPYEDEGVNLAMSSGRTGPLPNKYAKLMHFGFWLLANIAISSDISNEQRDKYYNQLKLFSDINAQAKFYDTFYSNEKETAKTMRKFITETLREKRKTQLIKETIHLGRDQLLRDAFIDNIIAMFNCGRDNNFALPCKE